MKTKIITLILALLTLTMQAQEIATWQGFRKGAASFTFNQGAPSHVTDVGPLFKKYGYKATFYLVVNWNPNWSGFQGLADEGHEIGSNSNSYPQNMTGEEASSKNNIAGKIKQKYGIITVAYPDCTIPDETAVLQNYIAGRICNGSWVGMDDVMGKDGPDKWSRVPALMTGSEGLVNTTSAFTGKMQVAIQKNGWVAFMTHGIQGKQNGNANYSPTNIDAIDGALRWAQQNDKDIWIAPLGYVAMYIKERNASTFELKGSDTRTRTYSLTHSIADDVSPYDYPLSLRVPLPEGWSDAEVRQGEAKLERKIDGGYVYFDAVPNAGDIVVKRVLGAGDVEINETNFPDSVFRSFVAATYDAYSDSVLSEAELAAVTTMSVVGSDIASLKGIEFFTALQKLYCHNNRLSALDLSANTELTVLYCQNNQLAALNLSSQPSSLTGNIGSLTGRDQQKPIAKAVKLADGRVGIDLGADFDITRTSDFVGISNARMSGQYLVIANSVADCPNEFSYKYDTNARYREGGLLLMDVIVTIGDKRGLADLVLLDNDEGEEYRNLARIADNASTNLDVMIEGRTIYRDGRWNAVCLPFNLEDSDDSDGKNCTGTLFEGAIVKRFDSSSYTPETKTLTLNFEDSESIWTGGPYLVRWESSESLANFVNPVFENVEILDCVPSSDEDECIEFLGTFSPVTLAAQDRTVLYLGGDSKLYYPTDDMTVNAFRGYFRLKNGLTAGDLPTNGAKNFVLNFGDSTTEIGASLNDNGQWINDNFYLIDGRKLQGEPTQKGVYIQNGKKIVK